MELIVLGSGAFAPSRRGPVRNPAGYAVRVGGEILLFDLGFGNLRQLARAGLDPADVTDVFLSHRHPDHCGDLPALLFMLRYDVKPRKRRLGVWGPVGLRAFWGRLERAHWPWLSPRGYRLEVRELREGDRVRKPGWEVSFLKVPHPTPALAYKLLHAGKSFVYSGDTGPGRRLAGFAAGADLLLVECTMPERRPTHGHLTPRQALAAVEASGCRRAVLTHLSAESAAEAARLVRPGGRVRLARDLMRVRI